VNTFHDAFLDVRRRLEDGEDPELIVPALLQLAESEDEIEMAEALFEDEVETDEDEP
jgi:hypothetical protein